MTDAYGMTNLSTSATTARAIDTVISTPTSAGVYCDVRAPIGKAPAHVHVGLATLLAGLEAVQRDEALMPPLKSCDCGCK
jgi:hypothetical protein